MPKVNSEGSFKIFIGSARETLEHAKVVARWIESLDGSHEVLLWDKPGLFIAGRAIVDQLQSLTRQVDGAVIVFGQDDRVWSRGTEFRQPRDNALIEYGLFAGTLGASRVLMCTVGRVKVATDLGGLVYIDLSPERQYIAEAEFRAWIGSLNGNANVAESAPVRTSTRVGVAALQRRAKQRRTRPRLESHRGVATDMPALLDSFLDRDRRDRDRLEEDGGPLRTDPMADALGRVIAADARFDPALVERHTELTIHADGEGECAIRETVKCPDATHVIRFLISGDSPVPDLGVINLRARCLTPRIELALRVVSQRSTALSLLLRFHPPIRPGHTVTYEVAWRWPDMWKKLVAGKADSWRAPIRSSLPVKKIAVKFKVDRQIPVLMIENRGDGGGRLQAVEAPVARHSPYIKYGWVTTDVQPGGVMNLLLRKGSRSDRLGSRSE